MHKQENEPGWAGLRRGKAFPLKDSKEALEREALCISDQ